MLQATIPFDEIVAGATARLAVIEHIQYLSVRDVIMHLNGKNRKTAWVVWDRLSPVTKEELETYCKMYQFPGKQYPFPEIGAHTY